MFALGSRAFGWVDSNPAIPYMNDSHIEQAHLFQALVFVKHYFNRLDFEKKPSASIAYDVPQNG